MICSILVTWRIILKFDETNKKLLDIFEIETPESSDIIYQLTTKGAKPYAYTCDNERTSKMEVKGFTKVALKKRLPRTKKIVWTINLQNMR